MASEISPWLTEYVDNRNWPVPPVISVLAFHPNDGDIMYLLIQSKVVLCNLQQNPGSLLWYSSQRKQSYICPQYLSLCATILDNYHSFFSLTETECHLPPSPIIINILLLLGFWIMVSICLSIMLDNAVIAKFSNSCYFLVMFIYQNHPLMYLLILFIFTPVTSIILYYVVYRLNGLYNVFTSTRAKFYIYFCIRIYSVYFI